MTPSTCAVDPVQTILKAVLRPWARADVIGVSVDWVKGETMDGGPFIPALPLP
ncbi:MAG: hypothetical protein ACERKY_08505 [Anaerolineales bacterium]